MFGIGKKPLISSSDLVGTVIGKDTYFWGSINSQEIIRIDGNFEGDVNTTNDLVVSATSHIKGQIKVRSATIGGIIEGNIDVSEKLELLPTAKVYGDIRTSSLSIHEGAVLQGACFTKNYDPVVQISADNTENFQSKTEPPAEK